MGRSAPARLFSATPAAAANLFAILESAIAFGPPGAIAKPSIRSAKPRLNEILGKTYDRLVGSGNKPLDPAVAMARINNQATAIVRGVDANGITRTFIATSNREVWKDLQNVKLEPGEELLPFVNRVKASDPHPDIVAAQSAQRAGIDSVNVASVCREPVLPAVKEIPTVVPQANFETPAPKKD